ncbi:MAG: hypothetical protein V1928_02095 [Parcubacteria group bacterium]
METKPFHETIVDAISGCSRVTAEPMLFLFELIKMTTIPTGHDKIIAAIDKFFDFPVDAEYAHGIKSVKENLLAQKQAAETKKNDSFDAESIKANRLAIVEKINELHLLCIKFDGQTFEDSFIIALRKELRELYGLTNKQ